MNILCDYIINPQQSQQEQLNTTSSLYDSTPQSSTLIISNLQNQVGFNIEGFITRIYEALPKLLSFLLDQNQLVNKTKNQNDNVMQEELKENSPSAEITTIIDNDIIDYRFGYRTKLFGQNRMKIVELFFSFLKMNHSIIEVRIYELKFFKVLFDLLLKEEWNNMLHNTNNISVFCHLQIFKFSLWQGKGYHFNTFLHIGFRRREYKSL